MELRHLRYFKSVVEAKGYRNASRNFHIAQAALSQAVADLEAEMNVKLFVKRKRGPEVQLTAAGEIFYKECKRTLEQVEFSISAAKRADKGQTSVLRIGFIPFATQHFLAQLIRLYKQENPNTELVVRELTPARQMEALAKGELDLAFTREVESGHQAFTSLFLFRVPLIAVMPESRVVSGGQIQIRDLAEDRLVLLERCESPPLFDSIATLCREAGFAPKIDSHAHLAESMFLLVRAGEGVAILPSWARVFVSSGLQAARLLPDTASAELVLLWNNDADHHVRRSFVSLVEAELPEIQQRTALALGTVP